MASAGPRRPNLFVVGAAKCGTSSFHAYLGRHPQIFMSTPKEPCFFNDLAELRAHGLPEFAEGLAQNEERYLDLFRGAGDRPIAGESSTFYTRLPWYTGVPERMGRFAPDARIVYLMRDPVERTVSDYLFHVQLGVERRDVPAALVEHPQYLSMSHYALQLRPYLDRFGRERVFTATLEGLAARPLETLRALFRWLGIDDTFTDTGFGTRYNRTSERVAVGFMARLRDRVRRSRLGHAALSLVPSRLRKAANAVLVRGESRASVMARPGLVEGLRERQLRETEELTGLLGRRFDDEWRTLFGSHGRA